MRKPVIWIAGGQDKGNDYSVLQPLVSEKVKAIVALGLDNNKIKSAFGTHGTVRDTHDMATAVLASFSLASPGDVVLLSPACASFDLFKNYMDRGDQFRNEYIKLKAEWT
jgi:UDP-N-acetylmuramoylalanine--D-glutamate ligase